MLLLLLPLDKIASGSAEREKKIDQSPFRPHKLNMRQPTDRSVELEIPDLFPPLVVLLLRLQFVIVLATTRPSVVARVIDSDHASSELLKKGEI